MVTVLAKIAPKCGAGYKSCNLKYVVKFQRKCWQNSTASPAHFIYAGDFVHCANYLVKLTHDM
jgi:hypothetical protein